MKQDQTKDGSHSSVQSNWKGGGGGGGAWRAI